ncbi:hypothetical protein [Streptomyces sp. S4.7]|uniref:hypothetical protein n=1 Tax=Streptomyces sp. S4.7 TaxID=2705439 RepID=UPI00193F0D3B|nr:hypothetical protein [Streptomyces sp. S4.7]
MPRGRHRHSPPLHRILPPSAVAGAAALCAAGAWLLAEPVALRGLVAVTAAAAATGAYLMRSWDSAAGRRVAELLRARASEEWKTEERIAELEADIDESREIRTRLETKLRAKRVELAKLRGEHAALLRRYATAETARASALEGRRQLAIEAAQEPKALPPAGSTPTASVYFRAAKALDDLTRNGITQHTRRILEDARRRQLAERAAREADAEAERAKQAAKAAKKARAERAERERAEREKAAEERRAAEAATAAEQHTRPSSALPLKARPTSSLPATRPHPGASAIVPYSRRHRLQRGPEGGFDFFGTQKGGPAAIEPSADATEDGSPDRAAVDTGAGRPEQAQLERAQREDLADVAGEEALAQRGSDERAVGQVIDLTEHDETEPLPLGQLRSAIGS